MIFTKWTLKCLITAQTSILKLPKTPPRIQLNQYEDFNTIFDSLSIYVDINYRKT